MISKQLCVNILLLWAFVTTEMTDTHARDKEGTSKTAHDRIDDILQLHRQAIYMRDNKTKRTTQKLVEIYKNDIKPLEDAYKFSDIYRGAFTEGQILAKPMILFLGPWSVGKSTMINYLLDIEESREHLHTGAEPTTRDFTVILDGPKYRTVRGMELVTDTTRHFIPLQKFGNFFAERLQGVELSAKLLQQVSIVDTPGIIENKKQQERGYAFSEVCHWFIDRADIIYLMFDPTKLDVGSELDMLFKELRGYEAKLRIILNKADTVSQQELMRVYGALFWSLSPVVNIVEPPRVYIGSFWSKGKNTKLVELFSDEEIALLNDLSQVIQNSVENKIAFMRRHALNVRLHALVVDRYINVYKENKCWFGDNKKVYQSILDSPESYYVFSGIRATSDISISAYDLPKASDYQTFFATTSIDVFKPLTHYCSFWIDCYLMDSVDKAITVKFPKLLASLHQTCTDDSCKFNLKDEL